MFAIRRSLLPTEFFMFAIRRSLLPTGFFMFAIRRSLLLCCVALGTYDRIFHVRDSEIAPTVLCPLGHLQQNFSCGIPIINSGHRAVYTGADIDSQTFSVKAWGILKHRVFTTYPEKVAYCSSQITSVSWTRLSLVLLQAVRFITWRGVMLSTSLA